MITKPFEILRKTRRHILGAIDGLSPAALNHVPEGFNNNIIWNLAHMVASQQGVCYVRGNLPLVIKEEIFLGFKPDTRPQGMVEEAQIAEIRELLFSTIDRMEADYHSNLFQHNPAWTNRYGVEHATIEDSIQFLLYHDGLHAGYIMSLKKLVNR